MERLTFDVGLVVPLAEEFRYVLECARQLDSHYHEGTYFYALDFGSITTICCVVNQMGTLPALHATTRLLGFARVSLIVLLGVGGALDKDLSLGDVVIAADVNEFQANAKAVPGTEGYEVRYSGRNWQLAFQIREAINHFEVACPAEFEAWRTRAVTEFGNLTIPFKEKTCPGIPSLHVGPIASGNIVAASAEFVEEVKRINRKFVAIDMEAAGVACAAYEQLHPLQCLVVRGMSDHANEDKAALEDRDKGAWRRYSVRNATNLLRRLFTWDGFSKACGLRTTQPNISSLLVSELRATLGGPWIVGVAFGFYTHGPNVTPGTSVVPMDLSRLQIQDHRIASLMSALDKEKSKLESTGDLASARTAFKGLVENFRVELASQEAEALLQDFDKVVLELMCPETRRGHPDLLIAEADRVEQEVGPEAVIELLEGRVAESPRIRERYVDTLATLERWADIATAYKLVDLSTLTRLELEHGISASLKTMDRDSAVEMLGRHRQAYTDNGARLFRSLLAGQGDSLDGRKGS